MKDALLIFFCFILILLFGFSIASVSLLTTTNQITWSDPTNSSLPHITVVGEGGAGLWRWQLLRDALKWGIVRVFGSVAESDDGTVCGTNKVLAVVRDGKTLIYYFRKKCH